MKYPVSHIAKGKLVKLGKTESSCILESINHNKCDKTSLSLKLQTSPNFDNEK